jgi:hypothetical protein
MIEFWVLILLSFTLFGCDKEGDPTGAPGQSFHTSSGNVLKIDDYPLYTLEYVLDYKFNEYLKNGIIPLYVNNTSKSIDFACTCFSAFGDGSRFLGRNYDWSDAASYYIVWTNPTDGYASVSTVDLSFFNYNHDKPPDFSNNEEILEIIPYYPFDGLNEKGVSIGMNAVPYARGPHNPTKTTIGELQLIRLVLDYAASTEEAISLIQNYNVRMEQPPIHYLIADSAGHSAIIEYVNGNMIIMRNGDPWQVTTNFIITGMITYHDAPCWRYKTAYQTLESESGALSKDAVLNLLEEVSVSSTRWSTVYDLKLGELQVAVGGNYDNIHHFSIP